MFFCIYEKLLVSLLKILNKMEIDLNKCEKGDVLIGRHGSILEYVAPTPWEEYYYLDHVVRYIKTKDGKRAKKGNYGTRTNDGFVFAKNRKPEIDEDIIEIIKKSNK